MIREALEIDGDDIKELEQAISQIDVRTSIPDIQSEYLRFNSSIIQFHQLRYVHIDIHHQHLKATLRYSLFQFSLTEWPDRQFMALKQTYIDLKSPPLNEILIYSALKDQYAHTHQQSLLNDRIRLHLPHLSETSISQLHTWYSRSVAYKIQKECIRVTAARNVITFVEATITGINEEQAMIDKQLQAESILTERLGRLEGLNKDLKGWREQRIERMLIEDRLRQETMCIQLADSVVRSEREETRRSVIAGRLERYHETTASNLYIQSIVDIETKAKLMEENLIIAKVFHKIDRSITKVGLVFEAANT